MKWRPNPRIPVFEKYYKAVWHVEDYEPVCVVQLPNGSYWASPIRENTQERDIGPYADLATAKAAAEMLYSTNPELFEGD